MDYYLPTALKLLNTYAQLSAQDVQGENISEAKQSIERSMDLLITAFENQLDKLFQSDALDISADVAALEDAQPRRAGRQRFQARKRKLRLHREATIIHGLFRRDSLLLG